MELVPHLLEEPYISEKMRQLYIIIFTLIFSSLEIYAQDSKSFESFRDKVLPDYSSYFSHAGLTENGLLELTAIENYIKLPASEKKAVLNKITAAWHESLVIVFYGTTREIWNWNNNLGAQLIDEWSLDIQKSKFPGNTLNKWYFSLGYQNTNNKGTSIYKSLYIRLGYFLYANRWDLSALYSLGVTPISESESSKYSYLSLLSRVYFPIKNTGISPNVGAGVVIGNSGVKPSLSLGISWFVGYGSLDFGIRTGDEVTTMIGYTVSPKLKSKK
jgi:hypothetical protein